MASLRQETSGSRSGWRLQFYDTTEKGKNKSIWLGRIEEFKALEIKEHVEHLVEVAGSNRPPCKATTAWLNQISPALRDKLARKGLCEFAKQSVSSTLTLANWLEQYLNDKKGAKASTLNTYEQSRKSLLEHFGKRKLLKDITPIDGERWCRWLKKSGNRRDKNRTEMSEDTVRRRTGIAKQFLREAVRRRLIEENPFSSLKSNMRGNKARQFFVEAAVIEYCMGYCPSVEWKAILALARYGGLRIPSELVLLEWQHVDLQGRKLLVHSPKNEAHPNGESRWCPIFPELFPYLQEAYDAAPKGARYVVGRYRNSNQNLRQTFGGILKRAGIKPWPKLFQNLRASRETELLSHFPIKDVCSWIGNSEKVALASYAMPTDNHFLSASDPRAVTTLRKRTPVPATGTVSEECPTCGCIGGCIHTLSAAITQHVGYARTPGFPEKHEVLIIEDSAGEMFLIGRAGLEPATKGL